MHRKLTVLTNPIFVTREEVGERKKKVTENRVGTAYLTCSFDFSILQSKEGSELSLLWRNHRVGKGNYLHLYSTQWHKDLQWGLCSCRISISLHDGAWVCAVVDRVDWVMRNNRLIGIWIPGIYDLIFLFLFLLCRAHAQQLCMAHVLPEQGGENSSINSVPYYLYFIHLFTFKSYWFNPWNNCNLHGLGAWLLPIHSHLDHHLLLQPSKQTHPISAYKSPSTKYSFINLTKLQQIVPSWSWSDSGSGSGSWSLGVGETCDCEPGERAAVIHLFVAGRDATDLRDRSYIYRTHVGRVITACGIKSST